MDGHGLVLHVSRGRWELDGDLGNSKVFSVPLLGEIITVEDLTVTTIDFDGGTTVDINGHVVLFSAEGHAWAMSEDWALGKLLSLQELGEGGTSTVLRVNLLNFD